MRALVLSVARHDLVFGQFIPEMDEFQADLEAAGIPYVNETGEYADFHSLRKTFATELAKAGVATRVAMELMRHSPKLTTKIYTDAGMLPIWMRSALCRCLATQKQGQSRADDPTNACVNECSGSKIRRTA
jgi:hypothetical protein